MRILGRLAVILLCLVFGTIALGKLAERWVIYPFDPREVAPADVRLPEVTVQHLDVRGDRLVVWTAPPERGKPVILYFHGNAGNLAMRAGRFRHFLAQGYGLIAPAYRGSSGSGGTPSEHTLREDAALVYRSVAKLLRHDMRPFPPDLTRRPAIVVYGESLGSAVAIHLNASAAADTVKGIGPPAAIILEAPFTSIADLAEHHYPGTAKLAQKLDSAWNSLKWANHIGQPLMVLHGNKDELIPIEMGRRIFAAAPSRNKQFLAVQDANHTNLWRSNTLPQLWRFVDQFALR